MADLEAGVDYWFDVTVKEPSVGYELVRNGTVSISTGTDYYGATTYDDLGRDHVSFNGTGWQGYFPLGWRGWAVAGYRAETEPDDRRSALIEEDDLTIPTFDDEADACQELTGGDCPEDNGSADFPAAYDDDYGPEGPGFDAASTEQQLQKAYAFMPSRTSDLSGRVVEEIWTGPQASMRSTPTTLTASRLGRVLAPASAASGSIAPPTTTGQVLPSLTATAGVGPLTGSFGVAWSRGDVAYLDMNGDQFPDVVRDASIEYTDVRGGHACIQEGGGLASCRGSGVDGVSRQFTITAGGGLSGSPVETESNSMGQTNPTTGNQAARGGQSSMDDFGDSVGAGLNVGASFSSPVLGAPGWDSGAPSTESGFDPADFGDIPGDPLKDAELELQQSLADVNGDGLPDQVRTTTAGVKVKLNLGYGFAKNYVTWVSQSGFESSESYSGATEFGIGFPGFFKNFSGGISRNAAIDFSRYAWVDVNGDNILDAMAKGDHGVRVGFGSGSGVRRGQDYGDMAEVPFTVLPELDVPLGQQIRQQSSVGWGGGLDFSVVIGPLCVAACYLLVNVGGHYDKGASITDVDFQDVNGDGYADSVSRFTSGDHRELLKVRLNEHGRTGLLQSVRNPLGGTFTLDYTAPATPSTTPDRCG